MGKFLWFKILSNPIPLIFVVILVASRPEFAQFGPPRAQSENPRAQQLPGIGQAPNGTVLSVQTPVANGGSVSPNAVNSSLQVQGPYQGSVTNGSPSTPPISLGLGEAVKRGLQYNLGIVGA